MTVGAAMADRPSCLRPRLLPRTSVGASQTGVVDGDDIAAFTAALSPCLICTVSWSPHEEQPAGAAPGAGRAALGEVPGIRRRQMGHDRIESRSVKIVDLDGHPAARLFPHAARAIKVVRSRRRAATGTRRTILAGRPSSAGSAPQPAQPPGW